jgi:hypothetical protein
MSQHNRANFGQERMFPALPLEEWQETKNNTTPLS